MNIRPYNNESLNVLYNSLFCDMPELYRQNASPHSVYPWNILLVDHNSEDDLLAVAADPSLESRMKLLAFQQLRTKGHAIAQRELLGVVIEVGFEKGLDVVAAFKDGTARYINQAEKLILWEAGDHESAGLIDDLFTRGIQVVNKIGPWNDKRMPPPPEGMARLNFLVSDGLYFGQGPFDVLTRDAMGGPVIAAATQLMLFLTGKVPEPSLS